jgi:superfamily II DNA or RNA helicase
MESISGRTLIIVPSVTLVNQLWSDFKEYSVDNGWNYHNVHRVTAGICKTTDLPITVSTWQSLQKLKDKAAFMSNFDMVIIDEAHGSSAKELQSLLEAALHVPYRIGMTGTLQDAKANSWVIEGLLGPVLPVVKAAELMKQGKAAQITIRNIILKHPEDNCKLLVKATYQQEIDFLCASPARNKFIYNLTKSTKGNTLVLFRYVDKHGKELEKLLQETGKTVHFISGKTKGDVREQIRHILATETNSVLLASVGVLAVGVSIRNLHNLVLTAPSKSKIKILQSIGRMMRLMEGKTKATVYDLADDLIHKKHINYTLRHFQDRIQMYASEGFDYSIHKYSL